MKEDLTILEENSNEKNTNGFVKISKLNIKIFSTAGFLALWNVIFLWGFWSKGSYALGLNAFVWLVVFVISLSKFSDYKIAFRDSGWITPIFLIILSYLIYDNPFIKVVNYIVFPFLVTILFAFFHIKSERKVINFFFIGVMLEKVFSFFNKIGEVLSLSSSILLPKEKKQKKLIMRIFAGIMFFFFLVL